jgi:hypothetical protein
MNISKEEKERERKKREEFRAQQVSNNWKSLLSGNSGRIEKRINFQSIQNQEEVVEITKKLTPAEAKRRSKQRKLIRKYENTCHIFSDDFHVLAKTSCIYFLRQKTKIVYIGETTSFLTRVSQHFNEATKIFDNVSFEIFSGSTKERRVYEKKLIQRYRPKYNVIHNKKKSEPKDIYSLEYKEERIYKP